jgi:hypothetical protein
VEIGVLDRTQDAQHLFLSDAQANTTCSG